ncbi:MAG: RDD family protein [Chloroflexi bacterium]|nr:RDD family protein [Chloroflexota bacterium]
MDEKPKNDSGAASRVYELAGLVDRFAASLIDSFLLILPLSIAALIISSPGHHIPKPFLQFVLLAVPIAYHWYFWTRRDGQTPGKFALGIRVIKADGSDINDVDAVIRAIGYHVSSVLFGLGFIWALFDKNNQSWHDKMARTYVVRCSKRRKTVDILA